MTDKTKKAFNNAIASARMEGFDFTDEQLESLVNIIEQVDTGKMTWQEAVDSLVKKNMRRSDTMEFTKVEYIKERQTAYVDFSVFKCGEIYHITNRDIDVNLLCVCFDVQDDHVRFIIIDELINALSLAGGYKGQHFVLNNDIDFVYSVEHIKLYSLVNPIRDTTEYTMIVNSRKSF